MKRIQKITVTAEPDYDSDHSELGEFSDVKGEFAVKHSDHPQLLAYFNADNVDDMKQARKNYERMMRYENGEVTDYRIYAEAEIQTPDDGKNWIRNTVNSGGLWGVEGDSDDSYFKEVADEQLHELRSVLKNLGFSDDEISNAPVVFSEELTRLTGVIA